MCCCISKTDGYWSLDAPRDRKSQKPPADLVSVYDENGGFPTSEDSNLGRINVLKFREVKGMGQRSGAGPTDEDMPWNDAPADSDVLPGYEEPDPAEVLGDEDNPRDVTLQQRIELGEADTLEERLAAEVPDRIGHPVRAGMELAEEDGEEPYASVDGDADEDGDLPAEEAAVNQDRD